MPQPDIFSQHCHEWYGDLIEYGNTPSELRTQILTLASANIANRRRLEQMIPLLEQLPEALRVKMVKQGKAILNLEYAGRGRPFRFSFNTHSRWQGQCSAASEFFSMIQQGLAYNDR